MMLFHIGEHLAAEKIEKALVRHFQESAIRTGDLGGTATTSQFTEALCEAVART
jgi:isocitrate/isopropylmalate dehydrogenase